MLGKRLIALAILALCALAPVPAVALGADEEFEGALSAFTLQGSHGYRIMVLASSEREDGRGDALVLVTRPHAAVLYATKAMVTPTSLDLDLGPVGGIDVDYVPLGGEETVREKCDRGKHRFERAVYRGRIELHGEQGYTDASARQVRIRNALWVNLFCSGKRFGEAVGATLPGASLNVNTRGPALPRFELEVKKNHPAARTFLQASVRETRGDVAISRGIETLAGPGAFTYEPNLSTAVVEPPSPFDGAAVFRDAPQSANRWRGNLTVDLPGRANTRLTAPRLRSNLVHSRWSKTVFHTR